MNKLFSKIAALSVGLAMAVGVGVAVGQEAKKAEAADVYSEIVSISSGTVVNGTQYKTHSTDDWIITFGGNNSSVGTNGTNRNNCKLSGESVSKYAVAPVTTSNVASAFVSKTSLSKVSKVRYTIGGGKNQTSTEVYLIYSSNDTSFSQVTLTGGTQGDALASGTEFVFNELTGYFGVLFKATNSSGDWRIDGVTLTFYEKEAAKTITSIALSEGNGLKKEYVDGDDVDVDNIVATATYAEGGTGDVTNDCTITADIEKVTLGTTQITYHAVYNGEDVIPAINDLVVSVSVEALAVSSLAAYGTIQVNFAENEAFSLGSGQIQANYNNGTNRRFGLSEEGLTVSLGGRDITGVTYYMKTTDAGAAVVIAYSGKTHEYNIGTVTEEEPATEGYYSKITSDSGLVLGSKYIIVNEANGAVMSQTQNGNNRGQASVTASDGVISSIPSSAEVFTLVEGTVDNTYGFKTHDNQYIYAASSSKNYLRTEEELDDNGSFAITFNSGNAILEAQGSNSINVLRYNNSNSIFSCYASSSLQNDVQLYKFVATERTDDQKAVDTFINTYMHLDDVDVNDHTGGSACKGEAGYYAVAKEHYASLTTDQKSFFATSEEFRVARARERLAAWAVANGETFNPAEGTFTNIRLNPVNFIGGDTSGFAIIVVISTVSVLAFGLAIMLRKKHR